MRQRQAVGAAPGKRAGAAASDGFVTPDIDPAPAFLRGGGAMGACIRAHDWSDTLGPPERWPGSLRTVVRLMLSTNHPVFLFWGPRALCLYNDAYSRSLGAEKHPAILGRPARTAWPEIWHIIGPQIEQVMSGLGATWHENQLVPIDRHGQREDVYWTYSYSPVHDEDTASGVAGVLVLCTETTQQVEIARRMTAAEARWRALFEQAPGFMCVLRGREHVFEFANPAYLRLVGGAALVGRSVSQALPWAAEQGFVALLDRVYATGTAHADHGVRLVVGEPGDAPAERYVDYVYQPIRDEAGAVVGVFVLGSDVTERERATRRVRDREERLRIACEAADLGIHAYDVASGAVDWDERVRALWGVAADEPVTLATFEAGLHPDDLAATRAAVARALDPAGDGRYNAEYRVRPRGGGAERTVSATGRTRFEDGRAVALIGTVQDITERRRAERRLRESEAFNRHLADTAPDLLYLYDIQARSNLWGNRQMTGLLGYSEAQIRAMSGRLIEMLLHPDDMPRYMQHAERQLVLADDEVAEFEYRMRRADGTWCWLLSREMVFRRRPDGVPCEIIGAALDITDRKTAEAAVQRRTAQLALLAHTAQRLLSATSEPPGLLAAVFEEIGASTGLESFLHYRLRDGATTLQLAAAGGVSAADRAAFAEVRVGDLMCGRVADSGTPIVVNGLQQQAAQPGCEVLAGAGVRCYAGFPLAAENRLLGTVAFLSRRQDEIAPADVALIQTLADHVATALERWRLIRELRAADRQKDEFLAMLAHELRNPLAPIATVAGLLGEQFGEQPRARPLLKILARQTRQLARLVDDLLDVSRIAQGRITLQVEPLDVASVAEQALESVQPVVADKGQRVRVTRPAAPVYVNGDRARLVQCVSNLLHNAAKYTGEGGQIEVEVQANDAEVSVVVADNGCGIAADLLPRVFDLFVQGGQALDRGEGGLGIGLNVVQRLMQMHGGGVTAESAGPGRGARFTLRLPRAATPAQPLAAAPRPGSPRRRVLVVDDNVDAAESMAAALAFHGHEVRTAASGVDALACVQTWTPDAVVLDIGLPAMDGYAVARELRRRHGPRLRLVALTGYGRAEDRQRAADAGFDGHLVKPADVLALERLLVPADAAT